MLLDEVLNDFGHRLGLRGVALNQNLFLEMELEPPDVLQFQKVDEDLVITFLTERDNRQHPKFLERMISLGHPDGPLDYPTQVGFLADQGVALMIRVSEDSLNVDYLVEIVDYLWDIRQSYVAA